jgi:flagellar protein FlaG
MNQPLQPPPTQVQIAKTAEYRDNYANSVQVRMSLWDFFLVFGTLNQTQPDKVTIESFQGIYLSPQQTKALLNVLEQNVSQYEATFGEIKLEPSSPEGAVQ